MGNEKCRGLFPLRHDWRFKACQILRLHALDTAVELEGVGLIGTDELDGQIRSDLFLKPCGPQNAVDEQAAEYGDFDDYDDYDQGEDEWLK